jgi:hypothetical protein
MSRLCCRDICRAMRASRGRPMTQPLHNRLTRRDRLERSTRFVVSHRSAAKRKCPNFRRVYRAGANSMGPATLAVGTMRDVFKTSDPKRISISCEIFGTAASTTGAPDTATGLPILDVDQAIVRQQGASCGVSVAARRSPRRHRSTRMACTPWPAARAPERPLCAAPLERGEI